VVEARSLLIKVITNRPRARRSPRPTPVIYPIRPMTGDVPQDARGRGFSWEGEWFESSQKIISQARVRYAKRQRCEKEFENVISETGKDLKQRLPRRGCLVVVAQ